MLAPAMSSKVDEFDVALWSRCYASAQVLQRRLRVCHALPAVCTEVEDGACDDLALGMHVDDIADGFGKECIDARFGHIQRLPGSFDTNLQLRHVAFLGQDRRHLDFFL